MVILCLAARWKGMVIFMTRIYLIRHAEAEGNLYRRAQGHWNGKITSFGKQQIDALAERFKGMQIDAIYSSDLSRAKETAGALQRGRNLEIITTPALREMCMGAWEGEAWGDIAWRYPEQMENFSHDPEKLAVPGSESFSEVQQRIENELLEIAAKHDGQTVAVVTHGMAIRIFLCKAKGLCSSEIDGVLHGDNTSVSLLEVQGGNVEVMFYNDNSHLGEDLSTFARQKWWRRGAGADYANLRFVPMDLRKKADAELYQHCYADAWTASHGSDEGFLPNVYLSTARSHSKGIPEALVKVMSGGDFAGLIELNPERGKNENIGWISLFYLVPKYRRRGFGVQLLGYSAAYFAHRGRKAIRLHVAVTNERAIKFYKKYGFIEVGIDPGVSSDQLLMEKEI
ncbi:MAG: GNAT family N-acetyltransferase [Clostridia bacterium]|nr:GNAT family N-acetyltransferase [Clostridia bacterium]